jgi:hypothetical protein
MTASSVLKNMLSVKKLGMIFAPIALVATGAFVVNQSSAAFSATTANDADTWAAGSVLLSNNHATALFTPTGIAPGYTESHCITITSDSDIPVNLKMYSKNLVAGPLAANLQVNIAEGTGGVNTDGVNGKAGSCTGFTASNANVFNGTIQSFGELTNYANGTPASVVAPKASKQYQITVSLPLGAPNSLQGTKTGVSFAWEAQS